MSDTQKYFRPVSIFASLVFSYIRSFPEHPAKLRFVNYILSRFFRNGISLRSNEGVHFNIPSRDWISHQIIHNGIYEPASIALAKSVLKEGDVFLDIGANMGLYSCILGVTRKAEVHAFEPGSISLLRLEKNLTLNHIPATICQFAVSNSQSQHSFTNEWKYNSGSASINHEQIAQGLTVQVASIDLDTYIRQKVKKDVTLAKIDVEGHELQVLQGIITGSFTIHHIILEFNEQHPDNTRLFAEINRLGYVPYDINGKELALTEEALRELPERNIWLKKR